MLNHNNSHSSAFTHDAVGIMQGKPMDTWVELGGTERGRLHVVAEVVPGRASKAQPPWAAESVLLPCARG